MTDLETPWATPDGVPGEAEWIGEDPFTQGGAGFTEESWADAPTVERPAGERWQESPFETPVEGFLEEGTGQWESFADNAVGVTTEAESVPGCGGPVSGAPPLIYRTSWAARSRTPWVGRAQTLLNVFLAQQRAGTESCTDQSAATRAYIASLRARLAPLGQDPLGVDCIFGEGTEVATLMFQACRGLLRDGKIGEKTWPPLLALGTTPVPTPAPTPTPTPAPSGVRVREDVWTLSAANPWHPTILWYARGVAALQARDGRNAADPRSWRHLADTHGTSKRRNTWPSGALWNQCEHESWHFLPWHRGYLHHFEKLIRAEITRLGGPGDWALPFWNYSDTSRPDVLTIPPAFRQRRTPDGQPNPLHVARRARGINDGAPMSTLAVRTSTMFGEPAFTPPAGLGGGFGGVRAPLGTHGNGRGADRGSLENAPHGLVHGQVGGSGVTPGLMSRFETAAQDPIFWLHHANVDRLWEAWLRTASHRNPTETGWLDGHWTFGSGPAVTTTTVSTRQMIDPRQQPLGYRYSDMASTPTPEAEWFAEVDAGAPHLEQLPPELVGTSEGEISLGPRVITTRVALRRPVGPVAHRLDESTGVPTGSTVFLRLENVTATVVHSSGVVVYLNIPRGGRPADFPDREAGVLSLFGVIEASQRTDQHDGTGSTMTMNVTRVARALAASGQWDPTTVDVTFVPIPDAAGVVEQGDVKVGRVSVFYA